LLGTGLGTEHLSAIGLSQQILRVLSLTEREPLRKLRDVTVYELMTISGVGLAKACTIVAAIELGKRAFCQQPTTLTVVDDPGIAAEILSHDLMWESQEQFAVLFLDIKHRYLAKKIISVGTQTETLAHPREIFREALQHRAVRILVAHNHPSGALEPSSEDIDLTRQLLQSAQIMGIPILDHLILGEGRFVSLRQTTTLWSEFMQE
jgi:DNA repair protein RadC